MSIRWIFAAVALCGLTLPACNENKGHTAVEREIPAPKEPPLPPPVRAERLDPVNQAAARKELETAIVSSDPIMRMHAIEAAQNGMGASSKALILARLKDAESPVRFAAAMAAGQLRLADARDELAGLINDSDPQVGLAVRYALHRLGDTRYTKDLQQSAKDPQPGIRANTAMILGMLGEPTGVRVLRPMLRDYEDAVRLQAAEALWRLGDEAGLKTLVSLSSSKFSDDQCVALLGLAGPRDRRVLGHIRAGLTAYHTEVQLVAARAAGMLGSDMGYTVAADAVKSTDPRQRHLAALALGAIGRSDAQGMLAELLKERESQDVRLAAAQAILQLQNPASAAGN